MKVSVVVCTYAPELYDDFCEAVESLIEQTYDDVEVVAVVDGTTEVCERATADWGDHDAVTLHCNEENRGLSGSRNVGIELAAGDVIAFMDDDAVADESWIEELVSVYEDRDAIAVGGRMAPIWVADEPGFLPAEYHWLIGVTPPEFAEPGEEVRNTFGSNISFRADVLAELGGFDEGVGRRGEVNLQAEEPLLGAEMRRRYGQGVVYNPDAVVGHKVFAWRTDKWWLLDRAFWQGYSKRAMETLLPGESGGEESAFLRQLALESLPDRLRSLADSPDRSEAAQLLALVVLTATVGFGYLYGVLKLDVREAIVGSH